MNGQIATNLVQTGALAEIADSTVTATTGRVDVSAEQAAVMSANSVSSTESGADAIGITLAFNTIGWEASNLLFNLVELPLAILAGSSFYNSAKERPAVPAKP